MEVIFLGSGGGRICMMLQKRATGGFIIKSDKHQIHIDPGPGALVRAYQYKVNPLKTDIIILSHAHADHVTDTEVIIEAMTNGTTKKKGILVANKTSIYGNEITRPAFSKYYEAFLERIICAEDDEIKLDDIKLKPIHLKHNEPNTVGYIIEINGKKIGYIADTEYFDGLSQFEKTDVLIINVVRPNNERLKGHLCSRDVIEILKKTKPKLAIIQHFGMKMLYAGPETQAKMIEKESGVRTIAAKDGMVINVDRELNETLSSFS